MKAEYIDHMGSDLSVVNAARVSFDKVSEWVVTGVDDFGVLEKTLSEADTKLIHYLSKHDHWTPFAHTSISLRMSAPVPIRTQCFKHKQGFVENEESRRYISSRPKLYVPDQWRVKPEGSVKQGSGTYTLPKPEYKDGYCVECGAKTISCGARAKLYCSPQCKSRSTNKHRNPYKTAFQNAQARVKREGVREWSLEFDTFEFPEYCKYLGIKLDYTFGKGGIQENSPSFDRIDNSKGYVEGNVEVISSKANTMKSSASPEELVKMAESILLMYRGFKPNYEQSYEAVCNRAIDLYEAMIEDNVTPEQARFILPQGCEVNWIWTGNLYAFANFYLKRTEAHAQKEIRDLAEEVGKIIQPLFPVSWAALVGNTDAQ